MFELTPKINSKDYKSFAKNLKSSVANLEPAFDQFGRYVKSQTEEQFNKEVDPDGDAWQPLSPYTLLRKSTNTILRETGAMAKSFFYRANKQSFEFGLDDFKYKFHHEGTSKMPARVVIGISDERKEKLNGFIIAHMKRTRSRVRK